MAESICADVIIGAGSVVTSDLVKPTSKDYESGAVRVASLVPAGAPV